MLLTMEKLDKFLLDEKILIFDSLDKLSKVASDIVVQKNNKILAINNEKHLLDEQIRNLKEVKIIKKLPNVGELIFARKNNKLSKKLLKKELKIKKLKSDIIKIKEESESKDFIDAREMTAFKVIAKELEEKEATVRNNSLTIEKLDKEKQSLLQELETSKSNENVLEKKLLNLEHRNQELEEINSYQLTTIRTLTNELKTKNEKIMELKEYFLKILDSYNDILQKVN